jgi:hypothetical protein
MREQIALVALLAMPLVSAEAGEINWSVANGFQQFRNDDDFQTIKQAWKQGMTAEDFLSTQNAASLRVLLPIDRTWWEKDKGVYNNKGLFDPTHNILLTYKGAAAGASCQWSINGASVAAATPCDQPATAINVDEKKPFTIAVSVDGGPTQELPDKQQIETRLIVAVGDSFASGEGNPDHAAITNTLPEKGSNRENKTSVSSLSWAFKENMSNRRFTQSAEWWDTTCHRSFLSWQSLYALRQAIDNDHRVVRYASFSCSGAEIYDGFFRAQLNPPVNLHDGRVVKRPERDGGNILVLVPYKEDRGPRKWGYDKDTSTKVSLNKSQLNSAVVLLCDGQARIGATKSLKSQKDGLKDGSPYYGEFEYDKCEGKIRKPDELLSSFGGNDFGFSGVVSWGLAPSNGVGKKYNPFRWIKDFNLGIMRVFITEDPKEAGDMAQHEIPELYSNLNWAFTEVLNTKPGSVQAMVYPNPFPAKLTNSCSDRMTVGNESLSERARQDKGPLAKNFIFRVEDWSAKVITSKFILPLQDAQIKAINLEGWTPLISQYGFKSPGGDRTICAVASGCDKIDGKCFTADLSGWHQNSEDKHPSLMPIKNITEWEAYDSTRMRGLRMANDSLMTQARFSGKGSFIQDDWISGFVHPVAQVHAGIADSMFVKQGVVSKQVKLGGD